MHLSTSYANVMSTIALFLALGGTTYAVARNEIKSRNIAPWAVKRSDIGANAVNGAKIAPGSIAVSDFAAGVLQTGLQGPAGPAGATGTPGAPGAKGDKGDAGDDGAAGATNVVARLDESLEVADHDDSESSTAGCQPGEVAVGGGFTQQGGVPQDLHVTDSHPVDETTDGVPDGWRVEVYNLDADNDDLGGIEFGAWVVCASP